MKTEYMEIVMKLVLNNESKPSRSILSDSEMGCLPLLIAKNFVCMSTNKQYHYIDSRTTIYKAIKSQISLLSEIL